MTIFKEEGKRTKEVPGIPRELNHWLKIVQRVIRLTVSPSANSFYRSIETETNIAAILIATVD